MKKVFGFTILLVFYLAGFCQDHYSYQASLIKPPPIINLAISTGLNCENGIIGGFGEINPGGNLTLCGGLGIGFWGYKLTGGISYYESYPYGIYYGISYTASTGLDSSFFMVDVEESDELQKVYCNLKPANCINLKLGYQWKLFDRGRIFVELGYAIPLQRDPYEIITPAIKLTESSKQLIDIYAPGGIILETGFSLGF